MLNNFKKWISNSGFQKVNFNKYISKSNFWEVSKFWKGNFVKGIFKSEFSHYLNLFSDGQVTGRGCSKTDRICVGEYTVQSRHLGFNKKKLTLERNLIFLDGFISSLGCQDQERVGHLYRGRDCENNVVENVFERKCYCRYHRCNHKDYYYSHSIKMNHSIILLLFTFCLTSLI